MKDLQDRVAVITGGASGIGLAMAEKFGVNGMKIVIADIEQRAIDRAEESLRMKGIDTFGIRTDVSVYEQVKALARKTLEHFGKVHLVINNAGVSITGPIWQLSLDDWRWVYDVNIWGTIHGIKAFVPILIAQKETAHIVNTASLAGFLGTGEHAPYSSSKAAALSISQALYSELAAWNTDIGVTCVCPGMVNTQIHRSWRNRPTGDKAWSERESKDEQHMRGSELFQGSGVPPEEVAAATLAAVRENRFYVFTGDNWADFIRFGSKGILTSGNPHVHTWGPDLRPKPASTETGKRILADGKFTNESPAFSILYPKDWVTISIPMMQSGVVLCVAKDNPANIPISVIIVTNKVHSAPELHTQEFIDDHLDRMKKSYPGSFGHVITSKKRIDLDGAIPALQMIIKWSTSNFIKLITYTVAVFKDDKLIQASNTTYAGDKVTAEEMFEPLMTLKFI